MPLSEDEQRILQEIEQQFYASDPEFAREVGSTTLYKHAGRNLKWAAAGFIVGVLILIASLPISPYLAFVGFLFMLASAFFFERNLRSMGRAGWQQWTGSMKGGNVKGYFGGAGQKMRDRFKRDE